MLYSNIEKLIYRLRKQGYRLAIAESCTGGGILKALTDIPGSSAVVWGGIVAYADDVKIRILNVEPETLARKGSVSSEVAQTMARNVKKLSTADWGIGVTGIAGPDGGTPEKPVGTVWIAWSGPENKRKKSNEAEKFLIPGNRNTVREQAIDKALYGLWARLEQ